MKKFKLLTTMLVSILTLAMVCFAFVGCAPEAKDFTFEAEDAVLADPDGADATIKVERDKQQYTTDGTGDELDQVGYFTSEGATITWVINSSHKCKEAKLTLRLAACAMDMSDWSSIKILEVDLGAGEGVELKVNGSAIAFTGKLPGLEGLTFNDFGTMFSNYQDVVVTIPLVKGENKIVLTSLGDGNNVNVDKIIINAASELTWTATDNSDRE